MTDFLMEYKVIDVEDHQRSDKRAVISCGSVVTSLLFAAEK